jgi:hypothetical protein
MSIIDDIFKNYALCDGKIYHFEFSFDKKELSVDLQVGKSISKNQYQDCKIRLTFIEVLEFNIFEDFPANGQYSDITLTTLDSDQLYVSFDPYGNSGRPHEDDDWIIKSKSVKIIEI